MAKEIIFPSNGFDEDLSVISLHAWDGRSCWLHLCSPQAPVYSSSKPISQWRQRAAVV